MDFRFTLHCKMPLTRPPLANQVRATSQQRERDVTIERHHGIPVLNYEEGTSSSKTSSLETDVIDLMQRNDSN